MFADESSRRTEKERNEHQSEKERLSREVELLTQRLNLMQRQLEKQQVLCGRFFLWLIIIMYFDKYFLMVFLELIILIARDKVKVGSVFYSYCCCVEYSCN